LQKYATRHKQIKTQGMNNAIYNFPMPSNEPVLEYLKGSKERIKLDQELKRQAENPIEIPLIIGGKEVRTANTGTVTMPHNHKQVLATYYMATEKEVQMAIDAANGAPDMVRSHLDDSCFYHAKGSRINKHQVQACDECRHDAWSE